LAVVVLAMTATFAGCKKDANDRPETVPEGWIPIRTAADLNAVRDSLSGNYILMNDISLADYSAGEGWQPIGDYITFFTGKFNGNGHKITNLIIDRPKPDEGYAGLFGFIYGGSVSNLGVDIGTGGIIGGSPAGGIAGYVYDSSTITNCYSTGSISSSSSSSSGGIAGDVYSGTITNCYSTGSISSFSSGGIAGSVGGSSTITGCYSTGSISSSSSPYDDYYYSGGIAGYVDSGAITGCAAINSSVASTGSTGSVHYAGRVAGYVLGGITVSNNFALSTMTVTGSGGNNGTTKTLTELRTQSTYSDPVNGDGLGGLGWKFGNDDANPWKMPAGGGYPILYWQ